MRKSLKNAFKAYLRRIGFSDFIPLGDDDEQKRSVTKEDSRFLLDKLVGFQKVNDIIIIVFIIMLCASFGIGLFFVFHFLDNSTLISAIFGGNFLVILAIIMKLRQLWMEKFIIDYVLHVLKDMQPKEAAKFIVDIYSTFFGN